MKIGFFEDAEILYQDEIHGSLLSMIDKIMETIRLKYLKGWISYVGISRIETYTVPLPAIREAVLNSIVHKDYSSGVPIQIRIYEDKIQISNTGHLPAELTAETMLESNTSRPHNPLIANTFFRCGFIESWGRGIDKMNKACIAEGLQSPVYQTISDSVIIKFEGHKPEEFIDKKTGSPKYWINSEAKEKELDIEQKNERANPENKRVNDVFERVNWENERVNERVINELQILYSIIEDNPFIKDSRQMKNLFKMNSLKCYKKGGHADDADFIGFTQIIWEIINIRN